MQVKRKRQKAEYPGNLCGVQRKRIDLLHWSLSISLKIFRSSEKEDHVKKPVDDFFMSVNFSESELVREIKIFRNYLMSRALAKPKMV
jgi:hypothetical protein